MRSKERGGSSLNASVWIAKNVNDASDRGDRRPRVQNVCPVRSTTFSESLVPGCNLTFRFLFEHGIEFQELLCKHYAPSLSRHDLDRQ